MSSYSPERKAALIHKLLPSQNMSVAQLSRQEGIAPATLYAWRSKLKAGGAVVPGDKSSTDNWSGEAKFAAVLQTASLSEIELSEYCRRNGLFPEQIAAWRQACITGQLSAQAQRQADREQARVDKNGLPSWSATYAAKTKRWQKPPPSWCCEKR